MFSANLSQRLLELVALESPTGQEEKIADRMAQWAEQNFGKNRLRRWRNGLLVTPDRRPGRPLVALVGHVDTVPGVAGLTARIQGDRLLGRGSVDMKAGVAVAMSMLEQSHAVDVLGVFYDREEGPIAHNGLLPLLERWEGDLPDFALVLEPTDNAVQAGCLGGFHATVTIEGEACHSARPWKGSNAIINSIPFLQKVASFGVQEKNVQGLSFKEVMSLTQATTCNASNVIPGSMDFNLNFRFAPDRTVEQARTFLLDFTEGFGRVRITDTAPVGKVVLDHELLRPWIERHGLRVEPKQAWTDVAQLSSLGVPAVNFGPGDPGKCHQDDEQVSLASLQDCAELVKDFLQALG